MKSFVCGGAGFQMSTDGVFSAIFQEDSNRQALLFMGQQHRLRSCFSEWIRNCHPPHYLKNIPNGIRCFYSRPGFRTLLWVNKCTARVLVFYSKSFLCLNQVNFLQRSYIPFFFLSHLLKECSAPTNELRIDLSRLSSPETEQSKTCIRLSGFIVLRSGLLTQGLFSLGTGWA